MNSRKIVITNHSNSSTQFQSKCRHPDPDSQTANSQTAREEQPMNQRQCGGGFGAVSVGCFHPLPWMRMDSLPCKGAFTPPHHSLWTISCGKFPVRGKQPNSQQPGSPDSPQKNGEPASPLILVFSDPPCNHYLFSFFMPFLACLTTPVSFPKPSLPIKPLQLRKKPRETAGFQKETGCQ